MLVHWAHQSEHGGISQFTFSTPSFVFSKFCARIHLLHNGFIFRSWFCSLGCTRRMRMCIMRRRGSMVCFRLLFYVLVFGDWQVPSAAYTFLDPAVYHGKVAAYFFGIVIGEAIIFSVVFGIIKLRERLFPVKKSPAAAEMKEYKHKGHDSV